MARAFAADGAAENILFAAISFDGRVLLLPQREIRTLESTLDIGPADDVPGAAGLIPFAGEAWPVYCLRGDLTMAEDIPASRRVCVLLDDGRDRLALLCDQFEMLSQARLKPRPMPACMAKPGSLIDALAVQGDALHAITTTRRLAALFQPEGAERADG